MTGPKLVRDKIPQVAAGRGDTMRVRTAQPDEMPGLLSDKLDEEIAEYRAAGSREERLAELADVLEVLHALAALDHASPRLLEERRALKAERRGGFSAGIVWAGDDGG